MNLKFRVWDTFDKYIKNNIEWGFDKSGEIVVWDGYENVFIENYNRYTFQPYIDMQDDNGKEIYEGDIIKHGCSTQQYESVVIYKAPSFLAANFLYKTQRYWKIDDAEWYVEWDKKGAEAFHQGYYRNDMRIGGDNYLEVIGNINENPELL